MSWAVRVAGPLLTITMSLCAGTAVANGAEKWPLLNTRGERGEGGPRERPATRVHVPKHVPST